MNRELFGDLVYSGDDECWHGMRPLARFARLGSDRAILIGFFQSLKYTRDSLYLE